MYLGAAEEGSSEVTRSHMEGQGRPASSGRAAEARAAGTEGVGPPKPMPTGSMARAYPPLPRFSTPPSRGGGDVSSRQMGRDRGSFLPHSLSPPSHLSFLPSLCHLPGCCLQQLDSGEAAAAF